MIRALVLWLLCGAAQAQGICAGVSPTGPATLTVTDSSGAVTDHPRTYGF